MKISSLWLSWDKSLVQKERKIQMSETPFYACEWYPSENLIFSFCLLISLLNYVFLCMHFMCNWFHLCQCQIKWIYFFFFKIKLGNLFPLNLSSVYLVDPITLAVSCPPLLRQHQARRLSGTLRRSNGSFMRKDRTSALREIGSSSNKKSHSNLWLKCTSSEAKTARQLLCLSDNLHDWVV